MQGSRRERLHLAGLVALAYVLALLQRTGEVVADTKVDLYVDPAGFLADVASAWTPTGQLGHVFGGQYGGHLFPMAPWFAGGEAIGLPIDRKSTRLNSSHANIAYVGFCLKKKNLSTVCGR